MVLETQTMRKVLVITGDTIAPKMAGPAIRATEIARELSLHCDVRVLSTSSATDIGMAIPVVQASGRALRAHVAWADIVVFQGFVLANNPWMARAGKILVADLYDPMHLEHLEDVQRLPAHKRPADVAQTIAALIHQIRVSDFFICASEKQRDLWIGHLAVLGRVNTVVYEDDSSLRKLIDVVPFGISATPPVQTRHAIKGAIEGIGATDKVILWGGGIYNWFDPLTLIKAMKILAARRPNVRLLFLGVTHPNPVFNEFDMATKAMALSGELELTNKTVFFNQTWVDYDDRVNYLLDADLGVSTHFSHLETAYSFRTRILDYLWAGLPIVSTEGDTFGDYVFKFGLGRVVGEQDSAALADALEALLFDLDSRHAAIVAVEKFRSRFEWHRAVATLQFFCLEGGRAPDLAGGILRLPLRYRRKSWLRGKIRGAGIALKSGGTKLVLQKLFGREPLIQRPN
jgi:glycosyltransferase involved in cell wall biosynthesis